MIQAHGEMPKRFTLMTMVRGALFMVITLEANLLV
jgi:hypothetical protein